MLNAARAQGMPMMEIAKNNEDVNQERAVVQPPINNQRRFRKKINIPSIYAQFHGSQEPGRGCQNIPRDRETAPYFSLQRME